MPGQDCERGKREEEGKGKGAKHSLPRRGRRDTSSKIFISGFTSGTGAREGAAVARYRRMSPPCPVCASYTPCTCAAQPLPSPTNGQLLGAVSFTPDRLRDDVAGVCGRPRDRFSRLGWRRQPTKGGHRAGPPTHNGLQRAARHRHGWSQRESGSHAAKGGICWAILRSVISGMMMGCGAGASTCQSARTIRSALPAVRFSARVGASTRERQIRSDIFTHGPW